MGLFMGILEAILVTIFVGLLVTYAGGAVIGATAILHGDALVGGLCMLVCVFLFVTIKDVLKERYQ